MLNFQGSVTAASTEAHACVCVCVWIRICTCDVSSRAGRGEMSLWSYLANAAASDKSFISLILRERLRRPCRTPPLQIYPAGTTQRHNSPSLVAHRLLPSFLSHPKPSHHPHLFALPHSFPPSLPRLVTQGNMRASLLRINASRLMHKCSREREREKENGKSKHWYMGVRGDWKKKHFVFHITPWLVLVLGAYQFLWPIHAF